MPIRLRWFRIDSLSPKGFARLKRGLLDEKYEDGRGWGFQVTESRSDHLLARYILRERRSESFRDPQGEDRSVEYLTFRETEFRIQINNPNIEVISPGVGIVELLNQIVRLLNYEVSISAIEFNPLDWFRKIKKDFDTVSIRKAVISDIELSKVTAACATIAGEEDVQKYFPEVSKGRKYVVDSALICFELQGVETRFEVAKSGRLKILSPAGGHAPSFFRAYLENWQ